ncbi:MAG: hypothetical protein U5L98_08315 [Halomonas sp.]|uniref:hypothetical protein n=1 Tax=Halomonas sp. TaxID=1486246 RepID=UPI002ACD3ABA|nr:hypothetical protein [Halomonas sp.]MDZ7852632.1 hypothetical protein [Halomonas sp.]
MREAMHSAFLYHAIQAGMDMGIVNAGQLDGLRRHRRRAARARRGRAPQPPRGRHRAPARPRRDRCKRTDREAKSTTCLARRAGAGPHRPRAREGHRRLHRGRRRGGPAEAATSRSTSSRARSWTA